MCQSYRLILRCVGVVGILSLIPMPGGLAAPITRPATPATQPSTIAVSVSALSAASSTPYPADNHLRAFNGTGKLEASIDIAVSQGSIVAGQGTVSHMSDDAGQAFQIPADNSSFELSSGLAPRNLSKDGKRARLEFTAKESPAAQATQLRVSGSGRLMLASQTKTVDAGLLPLKEGTTFKLGDIAFKITGVADQNGKVSVSLETHQETNPLRAIKFYDEKGELLDAPIGSSSWERFGFGKLKTMTLSVDYMLPRKPDSVRIKGEQWIDVQTVPFDFNTSAGLGLGSAKPAIPTTGAKQPPTKPGLAVVSSTSQPTTFPSAALQEVRCIGVMAEKPESQDSGLMAMNPGTSVVLLVVIKQGHIIGWGGDGTEIITFRDDRGTDLLKAKGDTFHGPGFDRHADFSSDERAVMVKIASPGLASPEAHSLSVKGTLMIDTASTERTVSVDKVPLVEKGTFQVGPLHYTISHTGKAQFFGDGYSVSLKTTDDITPLDELQFFDADGKQLKPNRGMSASMSAGNGKTEHEREFLFDKKLDSAKIVAKLWTDSKPVKVPLDLTVSLGTPGAK